MLGNKFQNGEVVQIMGAKVKVDTGEHTVIIDDAQLRPIAIDAEQLLLLGFVASGDWYEYLDISVNLNDSRVAYRYTVGGYAQIPWPKWVHKLQNLISVL